MTPQKRKILSAAFPEMNFQADDATETIKRLSEKKGTTITVNGAAATLKGEQGKPGKDGSNGKDGKPGENGKDGQHFYGIDGKDGKVGPKGDRGERGPEGRAGIDGVNGRDSSPDSPLTLANKLNTLNGMVNARVIAGLPSIQDIAKGIKSLKGSEKLSHKDIDMSDLRWHGGGVTPNQTTTFTNKRITKRVLALSNNSATPTINTDSYDVVHITAQTANITSFTTNLTGAPVDGDTLRISITGTGSVALTWGTSFESSTITLPTTTNGTARLDVGFFFNTETNKWRCVASA